MPKLFNRPLNDATWRKIDPDAAGWCDDSDAECPILTCFGLCIIHCAMRTMESCLKLMLTVILIGDLASGSSKLLAAVRDTYAALGEGEDATHLSGACEAVRGRESGDPQRLLLLVRLAAVLGDDARVRHL